jgi:hypothetical protein
MISPPRLISKNNLNAYKDLRIRDAQLLCLLMEANALDRKFERHFLETFLPKDWPKAGIGAVRLCQKFDRPGCILDYSHCSPLT